MFTGFPLLSPPPPSFPPSPCFPSVQFNSLPTDRCALLSEHLELATVLTEGLFYEALPGGSHGTCLNFKKSHVSVYKCFTLLLEIEQKFFVFVSAVKKPLQSFNFSVNISHIEHLWIAIHNKHNSQEGPPKLIDKRRSLKHKENYFFLAFRLVIN